MVYEKIRDNVITNGWAVVRDEEVLDLEKKPVEAQTPQKTTQPIAASGASGPKAIAVGADGTLACQDLPKAPPESPQPSGKAGAKRRANTKCGAKRKADDLEEDNSIAKLLRKASSVKARCLKATSIQ